MRRSVPRRHAGVTLLELCVVLAVLMVIAGTAVPPLLAFIDRQRLEGAASELAADLQYVRSEALARHQPLRLSVYTEADSSCYLIHTGARADCSCAPSSPAACTGDARLHARATPAC